MKNKKLVIFTTFAVVLGSYFLIEKDKNNEHIKSAENATKSTSNSVNQTKLQTKRTIASIDKDLSTKKDDHAKPKFAKSDKQAKDPKAMDEKLNKQIMKSNKVLSIEKIELVRKLPHTNQTVVVIKTNHNNAKSSFKALIENENGKILKTWAQKQRENLVGKHYDKLIHPIYK